MELKRRALPVLTALMLVLTLFGLLPGGALRAEMSDAYGLRVAGREVTSLNKDDILGDGSFKYDPDVKTLYVYGSLTHGSGFSYGEGGPCIANDRVKGLTINVVNDAVLTIENDWERCIDLYSSTTITGKGKLTLVAPSVCLIVNIESTQNGDIIIEDADIECRSESRGFLGCNKNEKLIVRRSSIKMTNIYYTVNMFPKGIELEGCEITKPVNYEIKLGAIYDADTNKITKDLTIVPVLDTVNITAREPKPGEKPNLTGSADSTVALSWRVKLNSPVLPYIEMPDRVAWFSGSTELTESTTFKEGSVYTLKARIKANEGYALTKDTKVYINGRLASTTAENFSGYVTYSVDLKATDVIPGDVDDSGEVNMKDITTLQRYVNGWDVTINAANSDLDGSGDIGMKDITALQRLINSK